MKIKKNKVVFSVLFIWFVLHQVYTIYDGLTDENIKSDIIVVLGNKVNEDGTLSLRLKARLDKSLELYNNKLAPIIFVSGGLGIEGHYEGTKMAEYLIKNGVDKKAIQVDDFGNTTNLTAINFKKQNPNIKKVIVVSQFYHITRIKLAFRKQGYDNIYGSHCNYFEWRDCYALFREFFGFYKYLLLI